jgi:catechol 2,3-dioxygenase-like lactoylglutathione lyase family enzyme
VGAVSGNLIELAYLYVGSSDVETDLRFYREGLGAELVWRFQAFQADVAAVRLAAGPLVLLADHRPAPSVIAIWSVRDLDAARAELEQAGWAESGVEVEVPDGPCLVLSDPSGNQVGLLHRVRPDAMPSSYRDAEDPHAVRE